MFRLLDYLLIDHGYMTVAVMMVLSSLYFELLMVMSGARHVRKWVVRIMLLIIYITCWFSIEAGLPMPGKIHPPPAPYTMNCDEIFTPPNK